MNTGLQIADYFLWALQRLYERGAERYVTYLQPSFRYVHDLDDKKDARYGVYYTRKKAAHKSGHQPSTLFEKWTLAGLLCMRKSD